MRSGGVGTLRSRFCPHKGDSGTTVNVIHFSYRRWIMGRFDLSDAEWRIIRPLLPNKPRGVPRADDRRILNGIFFILRTGSPWRDLQEWVGPDRTVYNRFYRQIVKAHAWTLDTH